MTQPLRWLIALVLFFTIAPALRAQNTISTQTLGVVSICPGSPLVVPFTRTGTYNANNTFTVQLSDGSDYKNIETGTASFNSGTNVYTLTATIPSNQAAGTTYSIRVTASSPAVIGTPSATKLTVKTKPNAPTGDSPQYDCQFRSGSANANTYRPYSTIYLSGLIPGSSVTFYDVNRVKVDFTTDGNSNSSASSRGFRSPAYVNGSPKSVDYYITQNVDGCESEKVLIRLIVKAQIEGGPIVTATESVSVAGTNGTTNLQRVKFCQGSGPFTFNDLPIRAESGYHTGYCEITTSHTIGGYSGVSCDNNTPITGSTSFETAKTGRRIFRLSSIPDNPVVNCQNNLLSDTYIVVDVFSLPAKPTVPAGTISLCQFQQAGLLTASATGGASLVWYGTNATGGTGSTSASLPSTTNAGTFRYYVAQKLNDCEGDRAEIMVEVKAASPAPTVSGVSYCQGAQAGQLSAVAASGGSLIWYTASSGGTGLSVAPTPSTNVAGVQLYYVSQMLGNSCESQRVALVVTVNGLPAAPTIPKSSYTFCQYAQGEALTATGQNLRWYETATGGTGISSLIPNTASAGTKIYYVSQSVNGCEGSRSSVTVDVLAAPSTPTVLQTNYEFCQGVANATISGTISPASQTSWYIYGDEPGLSNLYINGNTAYATISTAQARTLTYSLFQTATNGCKGLPSQQINITVKPTPAMPGVQSVAICQNTAAPLLQPTGQNLIWYTVSSGGTGSPTTPLVNTAQASQITYYVSQVLNGCESPRAALSVTVNAIPNVPALPAKGPVYCQNTSAIALAASGLGLKWYRELSGGTSIGTSVTPETGAAGNFTYYVSQTINGCEGGRSSVTVNVNASPQSPGILNNPGSFCQFDSKPIIVVLSKANYTLLTRYVYYIGGGVLRDTLSQQVADRDTISLTSNFIPTTEAGKILYTITNRDGNGCNSKPLSFSVAIKPIPGAPITSAISVCQNDTTQTLSADGKNPLWYTVATGGSGSATPPRVNTNQAIQTTYYVSQTVDGCEGPRASLAVTVKKLPDAPGVTQKAICQFANPEPVAASGFELKWYNSDGSKVNTTPIINTEAGTTFTYQVTQTVSGCESPKATLLVTVLTTPAPVVSKTNVELCQGANSQPLSASGTNLKWTDPNGVVSATAPAPPTVNASQKDGYQYYVTQTGTNGCESPKVPIRVFVQTVPTLSLGGSTITNLGVDVPIKLSFTGVGPYHYQLSNGLSGMATKDTTLLVLPRQTTVYQVVEVTNKCGAGVAGSGTTATITVLIPSIQTLALTTTTLCAGAGIMTGYITSGSFNAGSVFRLQFAKVETDSAKVNFVDMTTSQIIGGQLVGVVPATTPVGQYWIRVIATNPKIPILGNISPTVVNVRPLATAVLAGNQTIFAGNLAKLSVTLTGDAPWVVAYRDSSSTTGAGTVQTITAAASPYLLDVKPDKTTSYYLTGVSNVCSNGTTTNAVIVVNVAPLLSIEDQFLADAIDVFPVPATTTLTIRIRGLSPKSPASVELTDLTGQTLIRHETAKEISTLTLDSYPTGTYILQVRVGNGMASKRIVKL